MDAATKAKLDRSTYPCKAGWALINGVTHTGTIITRGPDYIEVQTEQGDTYHQAVADLVTVTITLNQLS